MSESNTHKELVELIYNYVTDIVPPKYKCLTCADLDTVVRPSKVIGNYIPDVLFWHDDMLIIGEAKTKNDFLRPHSQSQYEAYIHECRRFYGKSYLIIGVPWDMVLSAKNYFKRIIANEDSNIEVVVINEWGKAQKI